MQFASSVPSSAKNSAASNKRPISLAAKQLNYHNQHSFQPHSTGNISLVLKNFSQDDDQEGQQAQQEGSSQRTSYQHRPPAVMMAQSHQHVQQNSHSLGRDLQGMGLITQVRKGEQVPTALPSGIPLKQQHHAMYQKESLQDQGGDRKYFYPEAEEEALLGPQRHDLKGRKTLVLDLDETLVHSSFKAPTGREAPADIVLPVDIEGRICNVYILVRPGCVKFLNEMSKYYEVVIFTASLSKYADPLMDIIDQRNVAPQRLFREHCTFSDELGVFVKDMQRLGRDLKDVIIIDNSPLSFAFQPENGMPILSWYDDRTDTKLVELIPVLKLLSEVPDVRPVLTACCSKDNVYLTDKSLTLCSRIIEENKKRSSQRLLPPSPNVKQVSDDQGKETSASAVGMQEGDACPTPIVNAWISDSIVRRGSPIQQRGNRNSKQDLVNAESSKKSGYGGFTQNQTTGGDQVPTNNVTNVKNITKSAVFIQQVKPNKQKLSKKLLGQTCSQLDKTLSLLGDISITSQKSNKKSNNLLKSKKRPKTASREPSLSAFKTSSQSRQKQLSVKATESFKLTSTTPNLKQHEYKLQKSMMEKKGGNPFVPSMGSLMKAHTTFNSTRNSAERIIATTAIPTSITSTLQILQQNNSTAQSSLNTSVVTKSRADSMRKKPCTFSEKELQKIGGLQTPSSATKNLSKLTSQSIGAAPQFITTYINNNSVRKSYQSNLETPPQKMTGNLMGRLGFQTPKTKEYSSVKKTAAQKPASAKRLISKSPSERKDLESTGVTGGRTPGNIFTNSQQLQTSTYAGLMKNLSPTFKSMHSSQAPSKQVKISLNNSQIIKGIKLSSPSVSIKLINGDSLKPPQQQQLVPELNISSKNNESSNICSSQNTSQMHITSILNEFERTKNFNREILLLRNIGSPKQPSLAK